MELVGLDAVTGMGENYRSLEIRRGVHGFIKIDQPIQVRQRNLSQPLRVISQHACRPVLLHKLDGLLDLSSRVII